MEHIPVTLLVKYNRGLILFYVKQIQQTNQKKHWLLLYFPKDSVEKMFDCLGNNIHVHSEDIVKFLDRFVVRGKVFVMPALA